MILRNRIRPLTVSSDRRDIVEIDMNSIIPGNYLVERTNSVRIPKTNPVARSLAGRTLWPLRSMVPNSPRIR
jgi:hypothetical protein